MREAGRLFTGPSERRTAPTRPRAHADPQSHFCSCFLPFGRCDGKQRHLQLTLSREPVASCPSAHTMLDAEARRLRLANRSARAQLGGQRAMLSPVPNPPVIAMPAPQAGGGFCDRQLVTPAQGRHGDVTGFSVRRERTGPAPPVSPLGYESEGRTSLGSGCEMGGRSRGDSRPPNYCETLTFSFSAKNKRIDSPALCLFESPGLQNNPESRCSQRRKNASMLIFKRENIKSAAAGCHKADVPLSSGTAGSI